MLSFILQFEIIYKRLTLGNDDHVTGFYDFGVWVFPFIADYKPKIMYALHTSHTLVSCHCMISFGKEYFNICRSGAVGDVFSYIITQKSL
jgi:hypothetical protein